MALRLPVSCLKGKAKATGIEAFSLSLAPTRRSISSTVASKGPSSSPSSSSSSSTAGASTVTPPPPSAAVASQPTLVESTSSALDLLRSQPNHYIVASIAGRTLLMHPNDLVTLPRLNDVQVGDVLELDRIHEVGSRDYTLRAMDPLDTRSRGAVGLMRRQVGSDSAIVRALQSVGADVDSLKMSSSWAAKLAPSGLAHVGATLDPATVRARAVVVEHTKGRMEHIVKKKRRKGYRKTIKHKQTYTRLRIEGIQLGS